MTPASVERLRRLARKEKGLCQCCGQAPAGHGLTVCPRCAARNRRRTGRIYERRTSACCCRRCGEPAEGRSRVYCRAHAMQQRAYDKAWRERRRTA